jgi:dimethylamine monooxygenase subunit A
VVRVVVWDAFDGHPHRPRLGLRPLDPARWTEPPPGPGLVGELQRRRDVLGAHPAEAYAEGPGAAPAAAELLERLRAHLLGDHGGRYRAIDGARIEVDGGFRVDVTSGPPLAVAARLSAVDWCLVAPTDPPRLAAGAVCSPNRWRLADKLGLPLAGVHRPVPGYAPALGGPVDRILGPSGRAVPVWRRNWSMLGDPALWQPDPTPADPQVPEGVWVRSERQTLVPLPATGWWAFGIETAVAPLTDLTDRPVTAALVLATVAGLDPATAGYKELDAWLPRLLAWLGACCGSAEATEHDE